MKKYIYLAIILIVLGGIATIAIQQSQITSLKKDNARQTENVENLTNEKFVVEMSVKELKTFIKNKETEFAQEIDSVCKSHDIKVKNLQRIIQNKTEVVIRDTMWLEPDSTSTKVDSLYHLKFLKAEKCVSASVTVATIDPEAIARFDEIECRDESYSVIYKEKRTWKNLFKKRKIIHEYTSACGDITVKEINLK